MSGDPTGKEYIDAIKKLGPQKKPLEWPMKCAMCGELHWTSLEAAPPLCSVTCRVVWEAGQHG